MSAHASAGHRHIAIAVKLLTDLRRGDLLRLRRTDLQDGGIHVRPHKTAHTTGKRLIIEWTPALRAEIDRSKTAASKVGSIYIFPTRSGQCYVDEDGRANGFDSRWQRFMARGTHQD